ncbi:hypothetical protein EV421DRAFT_1744358 [Armillaria borealis]|uniref:Uncharacterized protein n=1 Tax=Armillaria borealis TaxID=47425 RepID=A0AA39IUR1_9AGAR|nr:hypothetical protein EV421DRAFT_1744358 [Armillaria borealis]
MTRYQHAEKYQVISMERMKERINNARRKWTAIWAWEKWILDNMDDYITLDKQTEFEPDVNPRGILATAWTKRNLIHIEDNKVRFYISKVDKEGERRFITAEPQIFHVGNIVKVQLSIVVMSMRKSQ